MPATPNESTLPVAGVYVHFPWCLRKCPYCDFASFERGAVDIEHASYADAVLDEIEHRSRALAERHIDTVFFGGGTPSLWAPEQVGRVLAAIVARAGSCSPQLEVTLECNPSSLQPARASAYVAVGVNRLSVGVQSLDASRLDQLGRLHDAAGGLSALDAALRSGAERVSADLMYGVATAKRRAGWQSPEQAASEASRVAATGVGHLSCYALTIEPNTRFGELARAGRLPQVSDAVMADSFLAVDETLAERGMSRYEISNWSRPGEQSRHNLGYWRGRDYVGLGCAAYGTLSAPDGSGHRYRNAPNPERYLERARQRNFQPHEHEPLPPATRLRERIMLGLRLAEGFDLEGSAAELGVAAWPAERRRAADRLVAQDRLRVEGGRLTIPPAAWLFADGTAAALF